MVSGIITFIVKIYYTYCMVSITFMVDFYYIYGKVGITFMVFITFMGDTATTVFSLCFPSIKRLET